LEKRLRLLSITLDYPPPVLGGYGVMCAQVCTWLKQRGHEVLVLTTLPLEPAFLSQIWSELVIESIKEW